MQNMVQTGLGFSIMPTTTVFYLPENTVLKNIAGLKLELPVGIALSSEKSITGSALNQLIKILQEGLSAL